MVEMALIFPILVLLLIGTLELGMAFKDFLTVSHAVREGSRVGAFMGDALDADCQILLASVAFLDPGDIDRLRRLEIYRADSSGSQILAQTNTWTYREGDPSDCGSWTEVVRWPSTERQVVVGSTPLDIIGVRIIMVRSWLTGFPPFSGSYELNETAIIRIEPEAFE
jgi:hypothetical protein